jgi:hypothetical protein
MERRLPRVVRNRQHFQHDPRAQVEAAVQRPLGNRQLPHAAERMRGEHHVTRRSRIVCPRNLTHRHAHACRRRRLRQSALQTDDERDARTSRTARPRS